VCATQVDPFCPDRCSASTTESRALPVGGDPVSGRAGSRSTPSLRSVAQDRLSTPQNDSRSESFCRGRNDRGRERHCSSKALFHPRDIALAVQQPQLRWALASEIASGAEAAIWFVAVFGTSGTRALSAIAFFERSYNSDIEGNARPTPGISCAGSGTSVTCWLLLNLPTSLNPLKKRRLDTRDSHLVECSHHPAHKEKQ